MNACYQNPPTFVSCMSAGHVPLGLVSMVTNRDAPLILLGDLAYVDFFSCVWAAFLMLSLALSPTSAFED